MSTSETYIFLLLQNHLHYFVYVRVYVCVQR